jgi:hypothetical protein
MIAGTMSSISAAPARRRTMRLTSRSGIGGRIIVGEFWLDAAFSETFLLHDSLS